MQFTISASALLAFVASVVAQNPNFDPVTKPTPNEKINAGTTYTIEWTAPDAFKDVTVSIGLIGGATQNTQVPLLDVASGVPNSAGKYSWTVPATLGKDAFYGLTIKSESNPDVDFQYSNPFHIVGSSDSASGTTTLTSSSGTATVTLSAASASSTTASSKAPVVESVVTNSTTPLATVTPTPGNLSKTVVAPSTITSVTKATNGTTSKTASPSATIATLTGTGAGAQATAGVFAVIGGIAVAALL